MKIPGVYKIKNVINNKTYVGSSVNAKKRIYIHFNDLRKNKHCNKHLQKAFNKYGENNFISEIIETIDYIDDKKILKHRLLLIEQKWIDKLIIQDNKNIGYNICLKANSCLGVKLSDEHKKKIGDANRGEKNSQYGRKYTDEEKEVLRQYSINMSKEARKKISKSSKGNKYRLGTKQSKETRKKISEGNIGKHNGKRTLETCKKISKAAKNRIVSEETRKKKSIAMTGLKRTKIEIIKRLITTSKEIKLIKDDIIIYCFNSTHAGDILNVNPRNINKAKYSGGKCKGFNIHESFDEFYNKDILRQNIELFNDKYYPNKELIKKLKDNNEK